MFQWFIYKPSFLNLYCTDNTLCISIGRLFFFYSSLIDFTRLYLSVTQLFFLLLFVTSWMRCWINFLPLQGRFNIVPGFLHLGIMALAVALWSPNSIKRALPAPLWDISDFVPHIFLNFLRSWQEVLPIEILKDSFIPMLLQVQPGCGWWGWTKEMWLIRLNSWFKKKLSSHWTSHLVLFLWY